MQGRLAALAFHAKALGCEDTTRDFRVRKMLEGWARAGGREADARFPLTPEILARMGKQWAQICRDNYETSLLRAASLVAFFGAFRISELVAAGKRDASRLALQWVDFHQRQGKVVFLVRRSKTDQRARGQRVELGTCTREDVCPVRAMVEYVALRGEGDGPLFRHADGGPLTKFQFWSLTQRALEKLGLEGMKFGTHSFRIGVASTAAALGYGPREIQSLGWWASASFKTYVRPLPHC
ncbi:hypothetical protein JRQ81_014602 [Phrynocephalus forsythii]|uniref:Tyr recombinase domain-containing protein n=1 Tax=Phrynocephalus forsythii TaxID=171643 RepID=A0A9Q0XXN8_9SAUR|nr:hypothetical protein JRQ81_014602 [Phrynocephalus forsythii]